MTVPKQKKVVRDSPVIPFVAVRCLVTAFSNIQHSPGNPDDTDARTPLVSYDLTRLTVDIANASYRAEPYPKALTSHRTPRTEADDDHHLPFA